VQFHKKSSFGIKNWPS